jgi:hypothetical protein
MGGTILSHCAKCGIHIDVDEHEPFPSEQLCDDCKVPLVEQKVFEGYANIYDETMNHPFDKSIFLYLTQELAAFYAEKAGPMKASLIGGRPRRVRIEVLD